MLKRSLLLLFAMILTISTMTAVLASFVHAAPSNLLQNSSFETATDPAMPDAWSGSSWGTNTTTFSYVNDAHTGAKAVQTTVSNYQDGDGKWLQAPVAVTAGAAYHYSDWYKATATTYLWAQYLTADNTYQYQFLKQVGASTDWTAASADLTIPAGIQKVSVFHVLAANGQLTIDDASLTQTITCSVTMSNGLANGGFEETCATNPATTALGWQQVQYGTTHATFNGQSTDAHTGALAATVTNVDAGAEAGYLSTIKTPLSNQRYTLSFWQKGDTYAYAYLVYTLQDGTTQAKSLMSAPATLGEWSHYSDSFVTPANLANMQVTIATSGAGTLAIDDVTLTPLANQTPSTFNEGTVSLTFDDGASSTYANGFPALKQYGYKGTFYLNAGAIGTSGFMTVNQVKALAANGQEIGSHLYHHSDMVQLDTATLQSELMGNKLSLQDILGTGSIASFASPYGSFTSSRVDTVMQYQASHRDTDGELNTKANLDVRQIHGRLVTATTTAATVQSWITEAKNTHSWLVLVYHNIAASSANQDPDVAGYNVTPTNFKKHLAAIKSSGVSVKTVGNAIATLSAE